MRPQPFGSAGSRQLRDGVCDAFELPFALWAPRRDASRGARWAGPLLGRSTERPPSRRDAEGDVSGQPRHAVASPREPNPHAEQFEQAAGRNKQGSQHATPALDTVALRQPPTHTTATSAPATSSRRTTTPPETKANHGQVHGLRRQGVRHEKGMAQVRDAPHVHLQGEDGRDATDEEARRC